MKNSFLIALLFCATLSVSAQEKIYHVKCGSEPLYTIDGTIANSDGNNPVMYAENTKGIAPGDFGEITKYFETHIFKGTMSGWTLIGEVEVVSVEGNVVKFKLAENKLDVNFGLFSINQFTAGKTVKFSHYNYGPPVKDSTTWANGNLKSKGQSICGTKVGTWSFYNEQGMLTERYTIDAGGKKNGPYESYYDNGMKKETAEYVNDMLNGLCTRYYDSGITQSEIFYTKGKTDGVYKEYYSNGILQASGTYHNQQKNGLWITNYESGMKESHICYYYDKPDRYDSSWYANGQLRTARHYAYGNPRGMNDTWYENGQHATHEEYDTWGKSGTWQYWYQSGQLSYQCSFVREGENGKCMEWYENGQEKSVTNYENGSREGKYVSYYENGKMKAAGKFAHDKEESAWTFYYSNGKKKSSGNYTAGAKTGEWKSFDEQGKLSAKTQY